jgi:hypothetical protein
MPPYEYNLYTFHYSALLCLLDQQRVCIGRTIYCQCMSRIPALPFRGGSSDRPSRFYPQTHGCHVNRGRLCRLPLMSPPSRHRLNVNIDSAPYISCLHTMSICMVHLRFMPLRVVDQHRAYVCGTIRASSTCLVLPYMAITWVAHRSQGVASIQTH